MTTRARLSFSVDETLIPEYRYAEHPTREVFPFSSLINQNVEIMDPIPLGLKAEPFIKGLWLKVGLYDQRLIR